MEPVIAQVEAKYKKKAVADVRPGDTARVHQKVREGSKERIQIFEGLVIRVIRKNSLTASVTVRRIASGVGVEKTFLMHSPSVLKIEVIKRSKVRRNYLSYIRARSGKKARLAGVEFDKDAVNVEDDAEAEAEEAKIKEEQAENYEADAEQRAKEEAKEEAKAEEALAKHDEKAKSESQVKEPAEPAK